MKKPDFIIVGAPKSGTTAMYEYLKAHPQIFMPRKEIHYFCSDLTFFIPRMSEKLYLSYFKDAGKDQIAGEASVWYLYSKKAAQKIKKLNSGAKIIIMLRNPAEMVYSLHSQAVFGGSEIIEDFEKALTAEPERKQHKLLPKVMQSPVESLFYTEVGKYHGQVQRYLDIFGKEKVKIITYEDFQRNTAELYKETLQFLGADDTFEPEFKVVNPNKKVRSKKVRDFLLDPPLFIKKIARTLIPHHTPVRYKLMNFVWNLLSRKISRPPMNEKIRQRLQHEFAPDVKKLEELLARDLSRWYSK